MSSFMHGGHSDEVIRVTWINDFIDNSKGLAGATRRATNEYKKAAAEQRKNDALTMKSGKEAALAAIAANEERRKSLLRYRELGLQEDRIHRGIAKRIKEREQAQNGLAIKTAASEKKIVEITKRADKEILDAKTRSARERDALEAQHAERVQEAADRIRRIQRVNDARIARLNREAAERKSAATAQADRELLEITDKYAKIRRRQLLRDEKAEIQEKLEHARNIVRKGDAFRLESWRKELARRKAEQKKALDADLIFRRNALAAEVSALTDARDQEIQLLKDGVTQHKAATKQRIADLDSEIKHREEMLKELEQLDERFASVRGIALGRGQAGRRLDISERFLDRDVRIAERQLIDFRTEMVRVREEARNTGKVAQDSFARLVFHAERARLNGREFADEMRNAGMEVRNFGNDKRKEIVFLRNNTTQMGKHAAETHVARRALSSLGGVLRFSTNEMIIFNQTIRILRIPFMASLIELAIRALNTLLGGITALVSALGPLAGQLAGIAPLALGAAQAFSVWKIATDNLGKSANNLSKIITTALTADAEDFQKLMSELPGQARAFAMEIRGIAPGFRAFREVLSEQIFGGMTTGLRAAIPTLRKLRDEFIGTASLMGRAFDRFGKMIGSAEWATDLQTQARNTNRWMERIGPGLRDMAIGFKNLAVSAAPLIDNFVKLTNRFGAWLRGLTESGRRSGDLSHFWRESNFVLNTTLSLLGRFGKALLNIGRIAYNIIGKQLLRDLNRSALSFRKWTESTRGQNKIAKYFRELKGPLYEMGRLLRDLVKAFFLIGRQKDFQHTLETLRTRTLPAIVRLLQNMQETFTPAFINLVENLVELFTTLTGAAGPLTTMVKAFTKFVELLNKAIQTVPGVSKLFQYILGGIVVFRTIRFVAAITGVNLFTKGVIGLSMWLKKAATDATLLNKALSSPRLGKYGLERALPATAPIGVGGTPIVGPQGQILSVVGGTSPTLTPRQRAMGFLGRNMGPIGGTVGATAAIGGAMIPGTAGTVISMAGMGAMIGAPFGGVGAPIGAALGAGAGLVMSRFLNNTDKSADALTRFTQALIGAEKSARARARMAREHLPDARLNVRQAREDVRTARARLLALRKEGADTATLRQAVLDLDAAKRRLAVANKDLARTIKHLDDVQEAEQKKARRVSRNVAKMAEGFMDLKFVGRDKFVDRLEDLRDKFKELKDPMAKRIQQVIDLTENIKAIPTKWQIDILINPKVAPNDRVTVGPGGGFVIVPNPDDFNPKGGGKKGGGKDGDGGGETPPPPPREFTIDSQRQLLVFQERLKTMALSPLLVMRKELERQIKNTEARVRASGSERAKAQLAVLEEKLAELDSVIEERITARTDLITRAIDNINRQFERASVRLQIRGIAEDSPGGMQFIQAAMQRQRQGLLEQARRLQALRRKLIKEGGPADAIKALTEQINSVLDQAFALKGAIQQQARDVGQARFQRQLNMADLRFRKLELRQQLAGTFDTGGAARAAFINEKIIPVLRAREEELKGKPGKQEELLALQVQILEYQLQAQEAIKDNTADIKKNTGNLSFEFQGQRFTDAMALGIGM